MVTTVFRIGFIIGVPLENFNNQAWVQCDDNLNKKNTLYTCAFIFKKEFRKKSGFSKTLKRVYTNWAKKKEYKYITGHVNNKINLNGNILCLVSFPKRCLFLFVIVDNNRIKFN